MNEEWCWIKVGKKKRKYHTRVGALVALRELRSLDDGRPLPRRFYKCEYCGTWHLTKQRKPKVKDKVA